MGLIDDFAREKRRKMAQGSTNGVSNGATNGKTNGHKVQAQVKLCRPDEVPWRTLGQYTYRILEDGSQTQMRLAIIESGIPPHSDGPVMHIHNMHDEGFIIKKGKIRFHTPSGDPIDAQEGDIITVPPGVPHKFSNPFDEEGVFLNTITPGFFVAYFEHLEALIGEGKTLTPEVNIAALKRFATVPFDEEEVMRLIAQGKQNGSSGEEVDL